MACELCTEAIALDQPCMELLCRHKVHTECVLRQTTQEDILGMRCSACREYIVPRQMMDEAEAVLGQDAQDEAVRYFWESDPQFKAGLIKLRESRTEAQKAAATLGRKEKELKAKLEGEVAPLVAQIEEKVAATKTAHKALPEKKEADKLTRIYTTMMTRFTNRWGVRFWRIRHALRDVAAIRSLVPVAAIRSLVPIYGMYRRRRFRSQRLFNIVIE